MIATIASRLSADNLLSMGAMCSSSKSTGTDPTVHLTEKQLEQLHERTNMSRSEILGHYRQFLRTSPTGRMTQEQFEDQLRATNAWTPGSRAIFEMIDRDKSGQISFHEYLVSLVTFSQQSQPEQQLGAVFDTYQALARSSPTEPSNELSVQGMTRNDIEHMLKRMHPDWCKDETDELCDRFMESDQNKNGFISKQEFIAASMKNPQLMEQLGQKAAVVKETES